MAGRPKKMLARVTAMEEAAFQLAVDVCTARPRQYAQREGHEGDDELAVWWNRAAREVQWASITLNILLGALESKAGLSEKLEWQRFAERGFLPLEETGAENAERPCT